MPALEKNLALPLRTKMSKKCQLETVLNYGSEGTVYSGLWCGKPVAIKNFSNNYVHRAENEMKVVANLNHINIIKYYDLEHEQGMAYLSMEYISGGNLYQYIEKNLNSSSYWTIISRILADVARGMLYLHNHNIVHGDLKSHNILLREENHQGVICDFGISRLLENDTGIQKRNFTAKGTVPWMAPEICTPPPELSSFSSDVWSYGCIILETTSGREPWAHQFHDQSILFRTLQRKENAPLFAKVCADQQGPNHICKLLINCCSWSKTNRPKFADILYQLDCKGHADERIEHPTRQISIDSSAFTRSYKNNEQHVQEISKMIIDEHDDDDDDDDDDDETQSMYSMHNEECNNNKDDCKRILSKSNRSQGRLTGELYSSRGSACGRPIYEGVRGGRYYLTPSGVKVYLHK